MKEETEEDFNDSWAIYKEKPPFKGNKKLVAYFEVSYPIMYRVSKKKL
ncbi:MAG: hypothetical protein GY821_09920 [Gammaproteobacteria bacterium]|nr:hypothetical protein [Gammaproteobacteria bacterium]